MPSDQGLGREFGSHQRLHVDRPTQELYVSRPVRVDGELLKAARQRRNMSVRDLSEKSGVSTSVIYRLEKGRLRQAQAETHTLRKLAKALDVDPTSLVPKE